MLIEPENKTGETAAEIAATIEKSAEADFCVLFWLIPFSTQRRDISVGLVLRYAWPRLRDSFR
jgi:hypothetical protein